MLSWRGRHALAGRLPPSVDLSRRPLPAAPLLRAWGLVPWPPFEWLAGPVDVVHGTNFVVPPARRAATVVTVHDLTAVRFPELCTQATLRYPHLVAKAVARGAFVHTPSQFVADEVVDMFDVPRERVRVVHHGIESSPAATPAARRGPRYILAIGTLEPRKDLPTLVRAFDVLAADRRDLTLVIAGEDGWGAGAVVAAVAAARHGDRIVRQRGVDNPGRSALISKAAALAFPSLYEGFGLPPLEAMALGTPVVATRAGAVPEIAGDAADLVEPGDVDGLAAALAVVIDDDAHAAGLVERGRRRVERFTWERCGDGLMRLYADAREARAS